MIKNEVLVQSPTRIDFAGGTLDCWPINAILGRVTTVNAAISVYTTCRLSLREDSKILIHSRDMDKSFEFENLKEALSCQEEDFRFYRAHLDQWQPEFGLNLSTQSDSPVGGGLGGSSSLSISVFKAFAELMEKEVSEYEMVRICSGVEAQILGMPTGTQDYFPAVQGGVNLIDYEFGQARVERLNIEALDISDHISVFYTGRSHHSGINNWQVLKSFVEKDKNTVKAIEEIQDIAACMREAFIKKTWSELPNLFQQEYSARMLLADSFSSPEIEKLAEISKSSGGEAINICGAGGGGCVFIWSSPRNRESVIAACQEEGFNHLDVQLV